jgi:hypothetical protein
MEKEKKKRRGEEVETLVYVTILKYENSDVTIT